MSHHHEHCVTEANERKTLWVIVLTLITMIAEIAYGCWTHSMALLADGYHMGTHALALGLTFAAYILMRKCTGSAKFPCGTEKIGVLAAYTSAIFLGLTGIWIVIEALNRFFNPLSIEFNEAITVAVIGLTINLACIAIMERGEEHSHTDYNFQAAYYHILADVLTSLLAIVALIIGKFFDIVWLDAAIGALGGALIIKWAVGLLKHTILILIDVKNE